jgi:hypothetical protein
MAKSNGKKNSQNNESSSSSTASAFEGARSKTTSATRSAGRKLTENPVNAVLGGFAVGAVLGTVIPATSRERKALQPVGQKLTEAARTAARQAAETGRDKLNRLTGEVVTQVGSKVVDAVAPPKESAPTA